MRIDLTTVLVHAEDEAIDFFTTALGLDLVEDTPRPSTCG
ncbi:VOC family protein [Nocardioides psychrotolerans]|uniref:Glyoxalase/Bleomycin resistance protein/Dioxygenase superfamily protein n=1 Tax=Nocardioides psychrotolerans TaxID=1005945 RepID=A0A1I3BTZ2_9ACTN|nr:VOC family protein [Nocardioides psychrotolerans]SFH65747.1 hypothetical protein SAMN05216561_101325 [Nocardioides psychrotolerans]